MKLKLPPFCVPALTMLFVASTIGFAQQSQFTAMLSSMSANAERLKQYTFKQRTEMYYKGELKTTKLDEVHYDSRGERVAVTLGEQKTESERHLRGPAGRLVARRMESKQEEMKDYIERLMALTSRYTKSDPSSMEASLSRAEVTTVAATGELRITMRNYVKNGDVVTMTFDSNKRPFKTEVNTSLDDARVTIALAYDQVRQGPTYPGKIVVHSEEKQLDLRVFTYDYRM